MVTFQSLDKVATGSHQVVYNHRRQPFKRLIEQDDLGITDQCASDRKHLLLATGQIGATAVTAHF